VARRAPPLARKQEQLFAVIAPAGVSAMGAPVHDPALIGDFFAAERTEPDQHDGSLARIWPPCAPA